MGNNNTDFTPNRQETPGVKGNKTFASKPVHDAPEGTIQVPVHRPTPAADRLRAIEDAEWDLRKVKLGAALDALREVLAEDAKDAVSATFAFSYEMGRERMHFVAGIDKDGEEIDIDDDAAEELTEIANRFKNFDYTRGSGDFIFEGSSDGDGDGDIFRLDLTQVKPEPTLLNIRKAIEDQAKVAKLDRDRLAQLGAAGIRAAIVEVAENNQKLKAAVSVILNNNAEDLGETILSVSRILDKDGNTIWDYDDGEDNLPDDFAEFAGCLDQYELDQVTTDRQGGATWKLEL